jgi:hypothetical protein
MRRSLFEIAALVLMASSLAFFYACIAFLGRHDYVAAIILMFVGFAVIRVGAELARVALAQRE